MKLTTNINNVKTFQLYQNDNDVPQQWNQIQRYFKLMDEIQKLKIKFEIKGWNSKIQKFEIKNWN